jgi:MFS family permease
MDEHSWQLESLIKRAFERTKSRFLSYLLTWIAGVGITLLVLVPFFIIALIIAGVSGVSAVALNNPEAVRNIVMISAPLLLILWLVLIYVGNWIQLATVKVLISEKAITAGQAFRETRRAVLSYFWFGMLSGLFFMGLMPFGFLSLFYIFLLWGVWGSFSTFVFLQQEKRGLNVLWTSKQMVDQKFWGIVERSLLIGFGIMIISLLIGFSGGKNGGWTTGLSTLLSVFTTPFILCFNYEMYKNLDVPQEVKKPKVWITLSVIGFVVYVGLMVLLIKVIPEQFGANLNNLNLLEQQQKAGQMRNLNNLQNSQWQEELKKFNSSPSGSQSF